MSKFVLYLEEDSQDRDLQLTLQRAGMTAHRCAALGMNGKSDAEQLAFAATNAFVLYTTNARDFVRLYAEYMRRGLSHAGIVFQPERRWSIGEQARRILRIWATLDAEEMRDRVESLGRWGEDRIS